MLSPQGDLITDSVLLHGNNNLAGYASAFYAELTEGIALMGM